MINLEAGGKAFSDLLAAKGWKVNGDFVSIPPSEDLNSKSKKTGDSFSLDRIHL